MESERVITDDPLSFMFNRYALLSTVSGAKNLLKNKAKKSEVTIDDELIEEKAIGLAFTIRSAIEHFIQPVQGNLTSTSLSYYYGLFGLLKAIWLADINNKTTLKDLEKLSNMGHGIYTIEDYKCAFPESQKIMFMTGGFISKFINDYLTAINEIAVKKRVKNIDKISEDEKAKLFSLKEAISRIPELKSIYTEIFHEHPNYLIVNNRINPAIVDFKKNSDYLNEDIIRSILNINPEKEIIIKNSGDRKKAEISRHLINPHDFHESVYTHDCVIKPLLGINDALVFYFATLYCLSIWVRYKPTLWREVCEGDKNLYHPLFENFLLCAKRIIPNLILNKIYGKFILFAPFSYLA